MLPLAPEAKRKNQRTKVTQEVDEPVVSMQEHFKRANLYLQRLQHPQVQAKDRLHSFNISTLSAENNRKDKFEKLQQPQEPGVGSFRTLDVIVLGANLQTLLQRRRVLHHKPIVI